MNGTNRKKEPFDRSQWDKLTASARLVILMAERLAKKQDKDKVTSVLILQTLAAHHPHTIEELIPTLPPREVENLTNVRSARFKDVDQKTVITQALLFAKDDFKTRADLNHLTMAAGLFCGFDVKKPKKDNKSGVKQHKIAPLIAARTLRAHGRDLTVAAGDGEFHEIVGRDKEIDFVIETLCRVFKRNPLLVGPAGTGKTAIIEGLAQKIASGNVAEPLKGKHIFELNLGSLVAGTPFRGMFEEKLRKVIKEASDPQVVLFIDELHSLVGAGQAEGSPLDASTMLLPALARGEIACIGATTDRDYNKFIIKNKALERRFQPIRISQLSAEAAEDVLKVFAENKLKDKDELTIQKGVFHKVVDLSERFIKNRYLPDKAIDILDQAAAHVVSDSKRKKPKEITITDVRNIVGKLTGLPVGEGEEELSKRLEGLGSFLRKRILGQDHIIDTVVNIIWPKAQGLDLRPERPNGVFLFIGPTGVGKTELARAMAEHLFDSSEKLIRLNMSEYSDPHTVSNFLGPPLGYRGAERGSPILESIGSNPFSILLLDEIEKAHPHIHRLFLQVFDTGVLDSSDKEHTFFSDVIIIMTSNIPVKPKPKIGFMEEQTDVRDEVAKFFPPEFVNRIDYIGLFNPLTIEIIRCILEEKELPLLEDKWQEKGVTLDIHPQVVTFMAEQGYSIKWGARNLYRAVEELLGSPLAKFITRKKVKGKITILVTIKDNSIKFSLKESFFSRKLSDRNFNE